VGSRQYLSTGGVESVSTLTRYYILGECQMCEYINFTGGVESVVLGELKV
jgi:hypothetical protein